MNKIASFNTIKTELIDSILIIKLHRPENLNAYTSEMGQELIKIFRYADEMEHIKAVILTGSGKSFCAGADLSNFTSDIRVDVGDVGLAIFECKKPTIAAIQGSAVGIGATMVLPMDIRVVAEDAKIGFVFSRRGIVMEACSSYFLPRIVGRSRAMEWVLTGRTFLAKDERDSGLFNYILPQDKVLSKAIELAKEIVENCSEVTTSLNKALMNHPFGDKQDPYSAAKIESKCVDFVTQTSDVLEGAKSFFERRKPNFQLKTSTDMPNFYPWFNKSKL